MAPSKLKDETPHTLSIPEAGKRYLGLGRNGSYNAAARGELPVIRVGGRFRSPDEEDGGDARLHPIQAREDGLNVHGPATASKQREGVPGP